MNDIAELIQARNQARIDRADLVARGLPTEWLDRQMEGLDYELAQRGVPDEGADRGTWGMGHALWLCFAALVAVLIVRAL